MLVFLGLIYFLYSYFDNLFFVHLSRIFTGNLPRYVIAGDSNFSLTFSISYFTEIATDALFFMLTVLNLILLLAGKRHVRRMMPLFMCLAVCVNIFDFIMMSMWPKAIIDQVNSNFFTGFLPYILLDIITLGYFLKSNRVKNTFVR